MFGQQHTQEGEEFRPLAPLRSDNSKTLVRLSLRAVSPHASVTLLGYVGSAAGHMEQVRGLGLGRAGGSPRGLSCPIG